MGTKDNAESSVVFKPDQSDFLKLINSKGTEREGLLYIMDVVLPVEERKRVVVNKMKDDELYNSGGVKDVGLYAHVTKGGYVHYYRTLYQGSGSYTYSLVGRADAEDFLLRHQDDGLKRDNLKKYGFNLFDEDV